MDLSKLSDSQRQKLEQLQKQFQEHQQQKQQEESAAAAAQQQQQNAYDHSQVHQLYDASQGYGQSYYNNSSYYNYSNYNYHQDPSQQQQQPYYQTDYSNAYQQQQQQQYTQQPETSAAVAAYTVSGEQQNEGMGSGSLGSGKGQVQDPNVEPKSLVNLGGGQQNSGYPVPPGLNAAAAAAVAALSQLTHFAGNMGFAEMAVGGGGYGTPNMAGGPVQFGQGPFHPQVGHSAYRGGGRRGGVPFRGGGRANFSNRQPGTVGSGQPIQGRGRGRGRGRGGRHDPPFGASSSCHPESSAAEEPKPSGAEQPLEQANVQQPVRIAWCELCRVDCTSKEILEQHKNGKRHKKNLQRLQDMKGTFQPGVKTHDDEKPGSESNAGVNQSVTEAEADKQTLPGSASAEVGTSDIKVETNENNDEEKKPWMKRKMRGGGRGGGRGAKRQRQATGPPKPKIVIPLICDLCNVKCDTQEVFDRHVAGKKHIAKLKRFEGHQAMYGPTAVQALYPPNPLTQSLSSQQAYYGGPGAYPPPEVYIPPQAQNPNPQLADAPLEFGTQTAASEPQAQQQSSVGAPAGNGV